MVSSNLESVHQAKFFDGSPVATFVINSDHIVTHFNKACAITLGVSADQVIGKKGLGQIFYGHERPVMADLIVDGGMKDLIDDLYQNKYRSSLVVPDAYEAEGFFPNLGTSGRWLFFTAAPIRDTSGIVIGAIETLQDITERKIAEEALLKSQLEIEQVVEQRTAELAEVNQALREDVMRREIVERELLDKNTDLYALNDKLSKAQEHLVQSEKLASIGQLAAGVAHEINNPLAALTANLVLADQQITGFAERAAISEDLLHELRDAREGAERVRIIVRDLQIFSHTDDRLGPIDVECVLDSTVRLAWNEVRHRARLVKAYAKVPPVEGNEARLGQVFLNLIVNAAQAITEGNSEGNEIRLETGFAHPNQVVISIADTGCGMSADTMAGHIAT